MCSEFYLSWRKEAPNEATSKSSLGRELSITLLGKQKRRKILFACDFFLCYQKWYQVLFVFFVLKLYSVLKSICPDKPWYSFTAYLSHRLCLLLNHTIYRPRSSCGTIIFISGNEKIDRAYSDMSVEKHPLHRKLLLCSRRFEICCCAMLTWRLQSRHKVRCSYITQYVSTKIYFGLGWNNFFIEFREPAVAGRGFSSDLLC